MKKMTPNVVVVASLLALPCAAQTQDTMRLPSDRLACLVRPTKLPQAKPQHEYDRRTGFMRVKLRFTQADAPPQVEMLHAMADPAMQSEVQRYLRGYRLPCLSANDPAVEAVQEFDLATQRVDGEVAPLASETFAKQCVVLPPEPLTLKSSTYLRKTRNVMRASIRFEGDGQQAPTVNFAFSNGDASLENLVRNHISRYRMPCRTATDPVYESTQSFHFYRGDVSRSVLKRDEFTMQEYLASVTDNTKLTGHFDLNTMACPFQVNVMLQQPFLANAITEIGEPNPNRAPLLQWMAKLPLKFMVDKDQAQDLFGTQIKVSLPCSVLKLDPSPQTAMSS